MGQEMSTPGAAGVAHVPGLQPTAIQGPVASVRAGAGRRALFLDRDGVINVDLGYVHTAEQTQWIPGIFELCLAARDAGFLLVVITNQAGIARGHYSEQEFREYTRWAHAQFEARGVPLAATYYCPHHPTAGLGSALRDCQCRKPKPGMILAAAAALGLNLADCIMVGDTRSDILAAGAAGVGRAFLLATRDDPGASAGTGSVVHSLLQMPAILGWNDSLAAPLDR